MAEEVKPEVKKDDDWMQKKWRPAMGWMYMIVCMLDMAIFPILWSGVQVYLKQPLTQWDPLTLRGAGLFHLAMGAVLGIAAWGRTQEKINGAAVNPAPPVGSPLSAAPAPSISTPPQQSQFNMPQYSYAPPSAAMPVPYVAPQPTYQQPIYIGGRLAPPRADQPLL